MNQPEGHTPQGDNKERITTMAVQLLNAGVDPKVVGSILSGSTPVTIQGNGGGGQGITFDSILTLVDRIMEKKGTGEQETVVSYLKERLDKVETSKSQTQAVPPLDTVAEAQRMAQGVKTMFEVWKDMGLIPPAGRVTAAPGSDIESLKETHRHEEAMEGFKIDREHKNKLADVASSIPERIGKGIAKDLRGGSSEEGGAVTGMESFLCSECKHTIYIPPDAGDTLHCGHCGQAYKRPGANPPDSGVPPK